MTEQSVQNLVNKFFRNECSLEDKKLLAQWIDESANDFTLRKLLENAWREFEPIERMPGYRTEAILSAILNSEKEETPEFIPTRFLWFKKISVACCHSNLRRNWQLFFVF